MIRSLFEIYISTLQDELHTYSELSPLLRNRLQRLEVYDWKAEEAYWRAKASRAKRKTEREKQKNLEFPQQEEPITEDKKRLLKIYIGKRL